MQVYPLKLKPVLKTAIWGGTAIPERFGIGAKGDSVAEAWMLTDREDGVNLIENGPATGMTLAQYAETVGKERVYTEDPFPLLIKLIDARDKLSVQVHPDDAYAASHGLDAGKTEMWYIVDAAPDASLILGIEEGIDRETLRRAAIDGTLEKYLKRVPVKKGDCYFIPAGLVHAIGGGILIAEIQQNSNTTYRLYDYDRVGKDGKKRELHLDKALEVIHTQFDLAAVTVDKTERAGQGSALRTLCASPVFTARSLVLDPGASAALTGRSLTHVMCLAGSGCLETADGRFPLSCGDSYLLPAALSGVSVTADSAMELVISRP